MIFQVNDSQLEVFLLIYSYDSARSCLERGKSALPTMLILMRSDQKLGNMLLAEDHQQVVNKGTNKEKK